MKHLKKLITTTIPQPDQIQFTNQTETELSFNWRGIDFTATPDTENAMITVTESNLRIHTCHSLLMQALLRECSTQ